MKKFTVTLLALSVLGLFLAACAKPPTEEMNKAQDAVIRAENDADAVNYAGNTLIRARDALVKMQTEADAKRYDAAKNLAAEAVSTAEKAIEEGKTGAARAKDEAANLLNSLSGPLADTLNALNAAKQIKGLNFDFNALSADLDLANKTYDDAKQSLLANNYREAAIKGQSVRSLLAGINTSINEAVQAKSRKQ